MIRYAMLCQLMLLTYLQFAHSHGVITTPATRNNPTVLSGWCPWCQGTQDFCEMKSVSDCPPPSPCWGATGGSVDPSKFNQNKDLKDPDGNYWVDQEGGENGTAPVWCPGMNYTLNWYNFADHNGIYQFESQLANPGDETEEAFKSFTNWRSVNSDIDTKYYDTDGVTPLKNIQCTGNQSTTPWSPEVPHCKDKSWSKINLAIPEDMPIGNTVVRLIWYGAMTVDLKRVTGPENSLFTNCLDIIISNSSQCRS